MRTIDPRVLRHCMLLAAAVLVTAPTPALQSSQGRPGTPAQFAQTAIDIQARRDANRKTMMDYSWKSRTEVKIKGEIKTLKIDLVRYTIDGDLQRTNLSTPEAPKKKRGIRGAVQKNKMKDKQEWSAELHEMLHQYSLPTTGSLVDYLQNATLGPDTDGMIKIHGVDVVQPGDELTMWVKGATKQIQRTKVTTVFEGDAVTMDTDYQQNETDMTFVARSVVRVPAQKLEMIVENFDYIKN